MYGWLLKVHRDTHECMVDCIKFTEIHMNVWLIVKSSQRYTWMYGWLYKVHRDTHECMVDC